MKEGTMIKKLLVMLVLLPFATGAATSVDLWFGGDFDGITWTEVMNVSPGDWVDIPVYARGENRDVNVADLMIPLGINNQYFDQFNIENCQAPKKLVDPRLSASSPNAVTSSPSKTKVAFLP